MKRTKADMIQAVRKASGLPYQKAAVCADSMIDFIIEALSEGRNVELHRFGTFSVRRAASKKTAIADVPAHGKVLFRPCKKLRKSVWNIGDKKQ